MEGKTNRKKVNLLGPPGVGKTSLVLRFVKNVFGEEYLKTIGTNVYTKTVSFKEGEVKLIINDIMGEKVYKSVRETAFRGSTGAIAVVDITRKETLESIIENWLPAYYRIASEENPVILAVNKFDLEDKKITSEYLQDISSEFQNTVFTSAKTGRNVEYMFQELASAVAFNLQVSIEYIDDIIDKRTIDTPRELLDVVFAAVSELNDIPYAFREVMLKDSGIEKFDLDEELFDIGEEEVFSYAEKLKGWYKERGDDYSRKVIDKAIKKYREES